MAASTTDVKSYGTANAKYNKFTDTTSASTTPVSLRIGESGWGTLSAGFKSTGNQVRRPSEIVLRVFTAAPDRAFVDNPNAMAIVGGERLFENRAKITDARTNGKEVYAAFEITLSLTDFEKIVRADELTISLGARAWIIPREKFSNWGDLLGLFDSK